MGAQGEQILENIIELAELLDDEVLKEMGDVPFLELAKAVSIKRFNSGQAKPFPKKRAKDKKMGI